MEPEFLKERLERFLKIIPAEYKLADEIKKSPKGFSTTLERVGKSVKGPKKINAENNDATLAKKRPADESTLKSKKKSLDEFLDAGMV